MPMTLFESIRWDYRRAGHSTHGHPLTALWEQLTEQGLPVSTPARKRVSSLVSA